jgi:hypothetical protein
VEVIRAILRVRRPTEDRYDDEITITPRISPSDENWPMIDWIKEDAQEVAEQLRRVRRLPVGRTLTIAVKLKPWSHRGYFPDEDSCGLDVMWSKTLRSGRAA